MTEPLWGKTSEEWAVIWAKRREVEERYRERMAPIWAEDREILRQCPLISPDAGKPGSCDLCGKPLPRLKSGRIHPYRRWCSKACSDTYWNNHGWSNASAAALKRDDYRCVRCGSDGGTTRGTCWQDGQPWPCDRAAQPETFAGDRRVYYHSERITVRGLEVNHIVPRHGRGYHEGCHHHLDGLETLCHDCHLEVTAEQRAARKAAGMHTPVGTEPPGAADTN